ncbi:EmrB/QacA subfamily drug resistance transporter [Allocatelliglobosispora scoriae]|uniref:EmrB/QacA subfamily drug resistance transporter n=1 Tax=Allocatelliglobosispora scoriae TaxID=643052 RepID=A0A841BM24_9ACTN|nr:MFS transporter [Allocatelliglobosispora scoriae]MBB5867802.1 EmrB/QacA subfamily drug resistance transporter [Allocatelliglobosispora scoriae]
MSAGGGYLPDPRRWRALSVCLVGGFMALLDVSIVNVALPSIRAGLHATESDLQWVISGYALVFGLVLVPAGRFGDMHGRRNAFVAGITLFTAASAAAGLAQTATWLVVARLVQGAAGGLINPQISGLIQQLFRGAERGRAFGMLGATIGISTAIGPLLGGLLIQAFGVAEGWRWVFYVNVPIGVLAIVLAFRFIPSHADTAARRQTFDPVGVLLLAVGVVLVLLPLIQERQWAGRGKWLLLVAGVGVLIGFVFWERRYGRTRDPVVDLGLFRRRSYALGAMLGLLYFAGFTAVFFVFTLYLQEGLGYSALAAGLATVPFALGSAAAASLGGRVVTRVGRKLIAIGLGLVIVGLAGMELAVELVPGRHDGWATAVPLLIAGVGSGLVIAPNQTLTLAEVPVAGAGSAGGVLQTGQRIGSAVGIAAVGAVFFAAIMESGDFARAFRHGLLVTIGFVVLALAVAVVDVAAGRRTERSR